MLTRVEEKTLRALEKMSNETKDQEVAHFFKLVKQTTDSLQKQSKYLENLHQDKILRIIAMSKGNPDLQPLATLLETFEPSAVAVALPDVDNAEQNVTCSPEFLSTGEVAFLLGLTPLQVRARCQTGEIKAFRANEGHGEWQIEAAPFIHHPTYSALLSQSETDRERIDTFLQILQKLSHEPIYVDMINELERERTGRDAYK